MSVVKVTQIGSKIAFVGQSYSKQNELANLLCKIFFQKGENYLKFSISDPVKTIAKEEYFTDDSLLCLAISSQVRKVKPSHWMDILKKKLETVDESCHIVIDDVCSQYDAVELSTMGFKLVNVNIAWMERFNNLMHSSSSDRSFRNTVKAFHYDTPDTLPDYIWDYKIKSIDEKYNLMYQLSGYNKNEVVAVENDHCV